MDKAAQTLADWDTRDRRDAAALRRRQSVGDPGRARRYRRRWSRARCKSSGLTGDRLTLELTESSIVQDPARATRVFDALKALDATVAMDDFGTGYSSLAYLQRLPIDVLKIDKSFVSGMMVDPDAWRSSARCSASPRRSACRRPPKGSRRSSWRRRWRRSAARRGQGYYFAKPLEAEAALEYWKSRRR